MRTRAHTRTHAVAGAESRAHAPGQCKCTAVHARGARAQSIDRPLAGRCVVAYAEHELSAQRVREAAAVLGAAVARSGRVLVRSG